MSLMVDLGWRELPPLAWMSRWAGLHMPLGAGDRGGGCVDGGSEEARDGLHELRSRRTHSSGGCAEGRALAAQPDAA